MALPRRVSIVEVGPRDGLQNIATPVDTSEKVAFIDALSEAGLPVVEPTSFVNPARVPQLADAAAVMKRINRRPGVRYPVLVPNERGLDLALEAGVEEIAVFASATETFSQRNLGRGMDEAIAMFAPVCRRALEAGVSVRGYVSMVFADPWEGATDPQAVKRTSEQLLEMGCREISLGDTIGVGTPGHVHRLLEALGSGPYAVHFHDTYGQGLANVYAALEAGIDVVDSSAGGLGGCPFADSATGNLATEDLVWMLDGLGIETGVNLMRVVEATGRIHRTLGVEPQSRAARALKALKGTQ